MKEQVDYLMEDKQTIDPDAKEIKQIDENDIVDDLQLMDIYDLDDTYLPLN